MSSPDIREALDSEVESAIHAIICGGVTHRRTDASCHSASFVVERLVDDPYGTLRALLDQPASKPDDASGIDVEWHIDDSYGACVVCREWVPNTDDEYRLVPWPCPTVRLARLTNPEADR